MQKFSFFKKVQATIKASKFAKCCAPTPGQQLATPPNFLEVYWDRTQHKHPQKVISHFSFLPDLTFTKEEVKEALHHKKAFQVPIWPNQQEAHLAIIKAASSNPVYSIFVDYFKEMNIPYDMLAEPNGCKTHGMQITEISAPRNWIDEFLSLHYMRRFEKIATLELTAVPGVIKVKTKDSSKTVPEYDGPPAPPHLQDAVHLHCQALLLVQMIQ